MLVSSGNHVWKRMQAWVANRHTHGVIVIFLEKLDQSALAVEASPTPLSQVL
jgi:hypothetical protein